MPPQQITHQNIFRVLLAGFCLVIAAAGWRRPRGHPQYPVDPGERGQPGARAVRHQPPDRRAAQPADQPQRSLFGSGARSRFGGLRPHHGAARRGRSRHRPHLPPKARAPPRATCGCGFSQSSMDFSQRGAAPARRPTMSRPTLPSNCSATTRRSSRVVARLLEAEYRKVIAAQAQIDRRSSAAARQFADFRSARACCWRWSSPRSPCGWCRS